MQIAVVTSGGREGLGRCKRLSSIILRPGLEQNVNKMVFHVLDPPPTQIAKSTLIYDLVSLPREGWPNYMVRLPKDGNIAFLCHLMKTLLDRCGQYFFALLPFRCACIMHIQCLRWPEAGHHWLTDSISHLYIDPVTVHATPHYSFRYNSYTNNTTTL